MARASSPSPSMTNRWPSRSRASTVAFSGRSISSRTSGKDRQPSSPTCDPSVCLTSGLTRIFSSPDADPRRDAQLIGRQPDTRGGVHRVDHVPDEFPDLVVDLLDGLGGPEQRRVRVENDGSEGHGGRSLLIALGCDVSTLASPPLRGQARARTPPAPGCPPPRTTSGPQRTRFPARIAGFQHKGPVRRPLEMARKLLSR
jgi:hypothetical protein